jgi:hypothetical protein
MTIFVYFFGIVTGVLALVGFQDTEEKASAPVIVEELGEIEYEKAIAVEPLALENVTEFNWQTYTVCVDTYGEQPEIVDISLPTFMALKKRSYPPTIDCIYGDEWNEQNLRVYYLNNTTEAQKYLSGKRVSLREQDFGETLTFEMEHTQFFTLEVGGKQMIFDVVHEKSYEVPERGQLADFVPVTDKEYAQRYMYLEENRGRQVKALDMETGYVYAPGMDCLDSGFYAFAHNLSHTDEVAYVCNGEVRVMRLDEERILGMCPEKVDCTEAYIKDDGNIYIYTTYRSIEDALKDNDPKQYCEYPEFVFNSETDSFVKTDECLMRGW